MFVEVGSSGRKYGAAEVCTELLRVAATVEGFMETKDEVVDDEESASVEARTAVVSAELVGRLAENVPSLEVKAAMDSSLTFPEAGVVLAEVGSFVVFGILFEEPAITEVEVERFSVCEVEVEKCAP